MKYTARHLNGSTAHGYEGQRAPGQRRAELSPQRRPVQGGRAVPRRVGRGEALVEDVVCRGAQRFVHI